MRELRHQHPGADVRTLSLRCDEPRAALLEHRVDAVVAPLLFPADELHVTDLYDEPGSWRSRTATGWPARNR